MASVAPFVRFITLPGRAEADGLLGFSLPFLPDMLTSPWFTGTSEQGRLEQALGLQVRLIAAFRSSAISAWDLRFVGTDELPGVSIGILCRLHRPAHIPPGEFHNYCLSRSQGTQQLFADFGYELLPITTEQALMRYLAPFRFQTAAEVRRYEEVNSIILNTYNQYEFYVTYPWHWGVNNRLRLLEALLHRQSNCLVSIYLEPTQLSLQEQSHLQHATSIQVQGLLWQSGPSGQEVYNIYKGYTLSLRQPHLLRISIAASNNRTIEQIGRILQDELHSSQPLRQAERVFLDELSSSQPSGTGPTLVFPQNQQEWQWACQSLFHPEWIPWGPNRGMDLPGTARLRYLVDDREASMAFRLPVAHAGDLPGVPVRSLLPTSSTPSAFPVSNSGPAPFVPPQPSTSQNPRLRTPQTDSVTTVRRSDIADIKKPEDLIGKILGSCQIEALLGQGGFGAVYRARQPHLQRLVAAKVILASISNAETHKLHKMMLRFDREAQAIARMDHPHILSLYEYQSEPLPYLVMPYVAGGSLSDEMKASGHRPLAASGVQTILNQVASALDYVHAQHVVHRDMKLANLLRHQDGRILLSDFGIVQFEGEELTALTTDKQRSPYTPAYASPEQHLGQMVDYRSDIYSLGIIIYELLCGVRPFKHPHAHVISPPPPMSTCGVQVHPAIEAVVLKALAKDPEQRHQSAGQFASEFQAALKQAG